MRLINCIVLLSIAGIATIGVCGENGSNQQQNQSSQLPADKGVNIALPNWGTQVEATSCFSSTYSPYNLADGKYLDDKGKTSWLCSDGVKLPQIVTFTFEKSRKIHSVKVFQSDWLVPDQYHSKDFTVEVSIDGQSWTKTADGTLKSPAHGEFVELQFVPVMAKALRIVITSSYDPSLVRVAGLGEVEIYAEVQKDEKPPYTGGAAAVISWNYFNRFFTLDPGLALSSQSVWRPASDNTETNQIWKAGPYRLELRFEKLSARSGIMRYTIARSDGKLFRMPFNRIETKSSYSGVYKMFHPQYMQQQNYKIDLPFVLDGLARAQDSSPVIWMQDTIGHNTFTVGMLNQVPMTNIEGSTYDPGNGGEAQGIANSYVRAGFRRTWPGNPEIASYSDGIYINADPNILWYQALLDYSLAVDTARKYKPYPISPIAFNPMWHTWYAHFSAIDQTELLADAKLAAALGFKTLEIDAGWNISKSQSYGLNYEGDYVFNSERFPDVNAMISQMHAMGIKVVLHVTPFVMGKDSSAYAQMSDTLAKVNGSPIDWMDPRLRKTQDFLLKSWETLIAKYKIDGLWYDFLEGVPSEADQPPKGMEIINPDMNVAYTIVMKSLLEKAKTLNPDVIVIMRRNAANLNAKLYCTHVWPLDVPQDYSMNRRDVVYMKTFGEGVLTHACCTSWAISESDENVARQMASITLAGVPALSIKLAESPQHHNEIIRAWLKFYNANDRDLVMGRMIPLLPTPPSAAIRIESDKQAFFGFFEAVPGLVTVSKPFKKIILVNAFSDRLATRLEGISGEFQIDVFDRLWKLKSTGTVTTDKTGLNLNVEDTSGCFAVVLSQKRQD